MSFALLFCSVSLLNVVHPLSIDNSEREAAKLVRELDHKFLGIINKETEAAWAYTSNITDANEKLQNEASAETGNFIREVAEKINKYDWKDFKDQDLKRQMSKLAKRGYAALPDKTFNELLSLLSRLEGNYAKVKVCDYKNKTKCDLSIDPEIEKILKTSRDPKELEYYWVEYYNAFRSFREPFERYIELKTEAAKLNNFTSGAEEWLSEYEDDTLEQQLEDILEEIKPLYQQLHGYVRWRLREYYGEDIVPEKGPIPMHLLGDIWGQTWDGIADIISPFPEKPLIDVGEEMVRQGITPKKMFEMGDDFFTSLNLIKLPQTFWNKSILEKPSDGRDLVCQASAWNFYKKDDVRIKMCTHVAQDQLVTVQHELGHIQYFLQYENQPYVYRDGANPGFHEAVGDVIALSVSTPKHLEKIGLLKGHQQDEEARIKQLFSTALVRIVLLPFTFTIDKYRWALFRGEVERDEWNCAFWKLREEYSGIEPPVRRTENDFDAPAKYHVSADVEYLRYFVSFIIQFQFYKSACIKANQYEPGNPELPLDNCDFYGSAEAGKAFEAMLKMGASKPWPDAMEAFTGERKMTGKAIAEYFAPLTKWLEVENKKNKVFIGWTKSEKCSKKPPCSISIKFYGF